MEEHTVSWKRVMTTGQLEVIVSEPDRSEHVSLVEILLVHGSCHTAECWSFFQEHFAQAGYRSLAFSLRGHGNSRGCENILHNRLWDYVADLEQVVSEQISGPFILIGHSLGGYIVQSYLHHHTSSLLACLVLTAATPSQAYRLSRDGRIIFQHLVPLLKAYLTGNSRMFYQSQEQTRFWFFTPETPQETVDTCFRHLQDESMKASTDIFHVPSPENTPLRSALAVPLLFVGAGCDALLPPAVIQASARAYGADAWIFPNRGHDLMLDQGWEEVAEHIVRWVKKQETV